MGGIVGELLGLSKSNKVSSAPVAETEEAKRTATKSRSALFETQGGVSGEELEPDQVGKRKTLLNN